MAYTFDQIKQVACSGAGVIGSSFAVSFALAGYPTHVYEINDACMERAETSADEIFESMVRLGYTTREKADVARARITFTTDPAVAFGGVQFIQENGPEKIEIKRAIVANLGPYAPADA
ncbi:MAG: 3-hydroxyacyl-CoA dehydrogenase family protein, partial [Oscillospiraceae bacterium]|nr:3-hydroxyacyl-CoA dehydrogenase family protein [Oscillospiraceae bacterium]